MKYLKLFEDFENTNELSKEEYYFLNMISKHNDEDLSNESKTNVDKALKNKSEKSGIPVSILRKVYSKGMQAWNAGHRPGVAQHQWGMGRVNSFITGSGGARKADADLWDKAKKAKKQKRNT